MSDDWIGAYQDLAHAVADEADARRAQERRAYVERERQAAYADGGRDTVGLASSPMLRRTFEIIADKLLTNALDMTMLHVAKHLRQTALRGMVRRDILKDAIYARLTIPEYSLELEIDRLASKLDRGLNFGRAGDIAFVVPRRGK